MQLAITSNLKLKLSSSIVFINFSKTQLQQAMCFNVCIKDICKRHKFCSATAHVPCIRCTRNNIKKGSNT